MARAVRQGGALINLQRYGEMFHMGAVASTAGGWTALPVLRRMVVKKNGKKT
jgi:hypothetical protein